MAETMVRMGELAASAGPGDVLVSLGLGSCIGLALLDRANHVAGLAHIMLPETNRAPEPGTPGKFADTGVPALLERVVGLGGRRGRLEAVLVGGAQMLGSSSRLDVGARNREATLTSLKAHRIPVVAAETGGSKGRTIRVHIAEGTVTVKAAGAQVLPLWPKARSGTEAAR